jgi:hypothetical protein
VSGEELDPEVRCPWCAGAGLYDKSQSEKVPCTSCNGTGDRRQGPGARPGWGQGAARGLHCAPADGPIDPNGRIQKGRRGYRAESVGR